eukprot:TRINITY_DN12237_c0_g2_i1.p1 TRINITY_DN12237_c0_g2~~TRINITY_DN12237_c0_g2_i1.p1  ORF type:complete len:781 (+),score=129.99 TRINITY_DN12237_c0_g2_i1:190-2532(+)
MDHARKPRPPPPPPPPLPPPLPSPPASPESASVPSDPDDLLQNALRTPFVPASMGCPALPAAKASAETEGDREKVAEGEEPSEAKSSTEASALRSQACVPSSCMGGSLSCLGGGSPGGGVDSHDTVVVVSSPLLPTKARDRNRIAARRLGDAVTEGSPASDGDEPASPPSPNNEDDVFPLDDAAQAAAAFAACAAAATAAAVAVTAREPRAAFSPSLGLDTVAALDLSSTAARLNHSSLFTASRGFFESVAMRTPKFPVGVAAALHQRGSLSAPAVLRSSGKPEKKRRRKRDGAQQTAAVPLTPTKELPGGSPAVTTPQHPAQHSPEVKGIRSSPFSTPPRTSPGSTTVATPPTEQGASSSPFFPSPARLGPARSEANNTGKTPRWPGDTDSPDSGKHGRHLGSPVPMRRLDIDSEVMLQGRSSSRGRSASSPASTLVDVGVQVDDGLQESSGASTTKKQLLYEDSLRRKLPVFILLHTGTAIGIWLFYAGRYRNENDSVTFFQSTGFAPPWTELKVHTDCTDLRLDVWRWVVYQYSHADVVHLAGNSILNVVFGVPLELFYGSPLLMGMYMLGVIGAACVKSIVDIHSSVVGMSGGSYSLVGMHVADLVLNWHEKRHRWLHLAAVNLFVSMDLSSAILFPSGARSGGTGIRVSHWTHLGGFLTGLLVGVVLGRRLVARRLERLAVSFFLVFGIAAAGLCVAWAQQWPPRNIGETGWCWLRQVRNVTFFGDGYYHCVRCYSEACVDRWSTENLVYPVTERMCRTLPTGYWEAPSVSDDFR